MSDAEVEVEGEGKKKSPLVKIIIFAVAGLVLVVGIVFGTLFLTGYFDRKEIHELEQRLAELEAKNAPEPEPGASGPQKVAKESPELTRFENSYMELEKPLVSNLTGTRKVIQVNLSIMTHYDDRVFKNVKKHEPALRSAALDAMRQSTEADLSAPDFRKNLAVKIRDEMNAVLTKYEDFGGIEEVFFTSFVIQ